MKKGANSNIYNFTANSVLDIYGAFIEATPDCMVITLSAKPCSAPARDAVQKSIDHLGFSSNACAWAVLEASGITLGEKEIRTIIEGLDPIALIALDVESAKLLGKAYRCKIALDAASRVFGRTTAAFRNFTKMLDDPDSKQRAWAVLKELRM